MGFRGRENGLGRTTWVRVRTDAAFCGLPSHLTRVEVCAMARSPPCFRRFRNRKNLRGEVLSQLITSATRYAGSRYTRANHPSQSASSQPIAWLDEEDIFLRTLLTKVSWKIWFDVKFWTQKIRSVSARTRKKVSQKSSLAGAKLSNCCCS